MKYWFKKFLDKLLILYKWTTKLDNLLRLIIGKCLHIVVRFLSKIRWLNVIFLSIPPLFFAYFLFSPLKTWSLELKPNEQKFISFEQINQTFSKTTLAELLQTKMNIGLYELCFRNQGALSINGNNIEPGRQDYRGRVEFEIEIFQNNGSEKSLLYADPGNTNCITIKGSDSGIKYEPKDLSTNFGALIYSRPEEITRINDKEFSITYEIDFTKMSLFIKNKQSAIVVKYFSLLFLWSVVLFQLVKIGNYIYKHKAASKVENVP